MLRTIEKGTWDRPSAAFSADGKFIVTTSQKKTAIVWDAASGKKLHKLEGHTQELTSVVLSRDGKRLLTGSDDHTAILWDLATGKKIRTFGRPRVLAKFVLRDGKFVREEPDKVEKAEEEIAQKPESEPGHGAAVYDVLLSRDGRFTATVAADGTAILWDTASGKKLQTFREDVAGMTKVVLSRRLQRFWTVCGDATIRLWDLATGKERCRLYSFDSGANWLVVTPKGHFDCSKDAWEYVAFRVSGTLKLLDDDAARVADCIVQDYSLKYGNR